MSVVCLFVCLYACAYNSANKQTCALRNKKYKQTQPILHSSLTSKQLRHIFLHVRDQLYLFVVWFVLLYADGCSQQCVQFKYPSLSDFKVDDANENFKCSQQSSFLVSHSNELLLSHNSTHDSDIL